jgi:membrane-bound metal-dependent hydrolase YbcI (DUF457 family)
VGRVGARLAIGLGCLATVAAADLTLRRRKPRWMFVGLYDHPAHLATAGLVLVNVPRRSRRWTLGFLAGSLLPDVDHVPLALRPKQPEVGDPRPVSHCLLAVAPVAAAAAVTQSDRLHGAACGMLAHFLRDVGVGTGAPLLWPASRYPVRVPYAVYFAICAALAGNACVGVIRSR